MKVLLSVTDSTQAQRIAALFAAAGHSVALGKGGADTVACWARERVDLLVLDEAPLLASKHPTAFEAGRIAIDEGARRDADLARARALERSIAADSARSERVLHGRVHERFARGEAETDPLALSDWLYRDVFLMPPDDPWLGLAPDDVYSAIEGGGLTQPRATATTVPPGISHLG